MPEKVEGTPSSLPNGVPTGSMTKTLVQIQTRYGNQDYWDMRYTREPTLFEWYQGYDGLKPLFNQHVPKNGSILQVGVGTSRIQESMIKDGYQRVINIDYSSVAIDHMREAHKGIPNLLYREADVRKMDCYKDGSFDAVIDKGTLDAILCADTSVKDSANMLKECSRVLKCGGVYILITYGDPRSRLYYLNKPELEWDISVYYMTKKESTDNPNCKQGQDYRHIKGPYSPSDEKAMEDLCMPQDIHFVYVCKKLRASDENRDLVSRPASNRTNK